jgi:hypothetical protein
MKNTDFFFKFNYQNGQALLIVVLVMVIALTVGLSIASKSITSFRSSTDTASSQKALSAAEAGIEQALKSNTSIPSTYISPSQEANYSTIVTTISGKTFLLNGGNPLLQDSGVDLWLTNYSSDPTKLYLSPYYYPSGSSFTIYWGDSTGGCNNAALEVVTITGTKSNPLLSRYAYDPCQTRSGQNGFTFIGLSQASVGGKTFYYQATIPFGNNGLITRIVPLYANAVMGVIGTNTFPPQGSVITSLGTSGTTQRKINVFQGYPEIPAEYYLYNLFAP